MLPAQPVEREGGQQLVGHTRTADEPRNRIDKADSEADATYPSPPPPPLLHIRVRRGVRQQGRATPESERAQPVSAAPWVTSVARGLSHLSAPTSSNGLDDDTRRRHDRQRRPRERHGRRPPGVHGDPDRTSPTPSDRARRQHLVDVRHAGTIVRAVSAGENASAVSAQHGRPHAAGAPPSCSRPTPASRPISAEAPSGERAAAQDRRTGRSRLRSVQVARQHRPGRGRRSRQHQDGMKKDGRATQAPPRRTRRS